MEFHGLYKMDKYFFHGTVGDIETLLSLISLSYNRALPEILNSIQVLTPISKFHHHIWSTVSHMVITEYRIDTYNTSQVRTEECWW